MTNNERRWKAALAAMESELDEVEAGLAVAGKMPDLEDRAVIDLDGLGPLPVVLAERAAAVSERTTALEAELLKAVDRVSSEIGAASRFKPRNDAVPAPQMLDRSV